MESLLDIKRRPAAEVLKGLRAEARSESVAAGQKLIADAAKHGASLRDYLILAIDHRSEEAMNKYKGKLNGFELALAELNLPVRNDYANGITLQAASETFQTFPGVRALFPEVVDNIVRFQSALSPMENISSIVLGSRTINGTELISTIIADADLNGGTGNTNTFGTFSVPELGRIPIKTIKASQQSVAIWKHGSGYRTSYEFNRRASLDLLTPFANRVARELELSKVRAATDILINGDGVNGAAPVKAQTAYSRYDSGNANKLQFKPFMQFLMERAKAGRPVDTVLGNYESFLEFIFLFTPTLQVNSEWGEAAGAGRVPGINMNFPGFSGANLNFVIGSGVPDGQLICFTKGETIEELIEAGSNIAESEAAIQTQAITYVRTENSGFKLAFGDTRAIYDYQP